MVIELTGDNLSQYISENKLIVYFKTDWCSVCKKAIKYLHEVKDINVIVVNAEKHIRSCKFYTTKFKHYPTIAYYENGYYIGDIDDYSEINEELIKLTS